MQVGGCCCGNLGCKFCDPNYYYPGYPNTNPIPPINQLGSLFNPQLSLQLLELITELTKWLKKQNEAHSQR